MKTTSLPTLSLLVAVAALVLLPLSVQLSASVIAVAGALAILFGDYATERKPVSVVTLSARRCNRSSLPFAA